jgi:hypothetical protein
MHYGEPPVLATNRIGSWIRTSLIMFGIFVVAVIIIRSRAKA